MKQMKKFSALVTGSMAIGLLLGTSLAHAEEEVCFDGDTVTEIMTVTSGAVFGDDFNPDDVNYDPWGTITFNFSSCEAGTASYNSPEFGTGTFNLFHLTRISGLTCP
jgi:hypothetical protein